MSLERATEEVRLTVHDNGPGGELAEGAGLSGMRARLTALGGRLDIQHANGTRLVLRIPATDTISHPTLAAS